MPATERIEATIPTERHAQLSELANELHLTKSALVDEALSVLMKAVIETRLGRRVAFIDAVSLQVVSQVATPLLTQIEWATHREKIRLSREEADRLGELLENPAPPPTSALRKAVARHRRSPVK